MAIVEDYEIRDKSSKGLGKVNQAFKATGVVALGAGAAAAVGLGKAIFAASDLAEAESKTNQVFGESASIIQDFAKTSARAFGVTREQANDFSSQLGSIFKNAGLGEEMAARMGKRFVELSADVASFNNLDPAEAFEKLRSGILGSTEPLQSIGAGYTAAELSAYAYSSGLAEVDTKLTEQQKTLARYFLILKKTKDSHGDFERTNDGLANSIRIAKAGFQEFAVDVGTLFLPLVTEAMQNLLVAFDFFSGWFAENQDVIKGHIETLGDTAREWFGYFFEGVKTLFDYLRNNHKAIIAILGFIGVSVAVALGPVGVAGLAIVGAIALFGKYKDSMEQLKVDLLIIGKDIVKALASFAVGAARVLVRGFLFLNVELPLLMGEIGLKAGEALINGIVRWLREFEVPGFDGPFGLGFPAFKPFGRLKTVKFGGAAEFLSGLRSQVRGDVAGKLDSIVSPLQGTLHKGIDKFFDPRIAAAKQTVINVANLKADEQHAADLVLTIADAEAIYGT